ncbi:HNH endonuclease [Suttonella ornithocola]|uniref:HNH endonuclease n=1 Tax=Suttonella ornithocola TaxID=279832 RepID=A0A380N285_9GAMM|nr:HNH endonuclease [Suttonella ornithocola]SUO97887.1 Uncharacterised protein [Suttonella ornithocola]
MIDKFSLEQSHLFRQPLEQIKQADEPGICDIAKGFLPREGGRWQDIPGDGKWLPNPDFIPKKDNVLEQTWAELLAKYKIDGIEFKEGDPDFSPVVKERVEIDNFTTDRSKNFAQADEKLAEKLGITPREVKEMRQKEGYTWHECKDCKTMELVPKEIHNNIPHTGGISEAKKSNS